MKLKKYKRFISQYFLKDGDIYSNVPCAYQKNKTALYRLGSFTEVKELINQLEEIKDFYERKNKDK